ncbi:hypothetical protein [Kurthia sp. Dielmo]|uniref:hypothetical protein n=1 Tax=Kurthia sp. Dielmo TaxID=1033738 RepID=UPI00111E1FC6|nr:hypothetical protein [Kurthia sp. Dielmo]
MLMVNTKGITGWSALTFNAIDSLEQVSVGDVVSFSQATLDGKSVREFVVKVIDKQTQTITFEPTASVVLPAQKFA